MYWIVVTTSALLWSALLNNVKRTHTVQIELVLGVRNVVP